MKESSGGRVCRGIPHPCGFTHYILCCLICSLCEFLKICFCLWTYIFWLFRQVGENISHTHTCPKQLPSAAGSACSCGSEAQAEQSRGGQHIARVLKCPRPFLYVSATQNLGGHAASGKEGSWYVWCQLLWWREEKHRDALPVSLPATKSPEAASSDLQGSSAGLATSCVRHNRTQDAPFFLWESSRQRCNSKTANAGAAEPTWSVQKDAKHYSCGWQMCLEWPNR